MVSETKVLIGVATSGLLRDSVFMDYIYQLDRPEGTLFTISHGASPAKGRNMIIEHALQNNCTHVLFVDDDMAPPPYALMRLLSHDKDVTTGLYLMRSYPHLPVTFDEAFPDGKNKHLFLKPELEGLIEVTNCGLGFVLIKTEVFKKMDKPWVTLGEIEKDGWCDDISFFNRVRQAGFSIYCDLNCQIGHFARTLISPKKEENGNWFTVYNTGSMDAIQFPQMVPNHVPSD